MASLPRIWELHPALVHFPIALLLSGIVLDLIDWYRANQTLTGVATWILIAGVGTGIVAANFGLLAFYTVPAHTEDAHTLMFWHAGMAVSSLALFGGVAFARWRRRSGQPSLSSRMFGLAAGALLSITGYLGGDIVYHGGAGVDPELLASAVREKHSHGQGGSQHRHAMQHETQGKGQRKGIRAAEHGIEDESGMQPSTHGESEEHESHETKTPEAAGIGKKQEAEEYATRLRGHEAHSLEEAPKELPKVPPPDPEAAELPTGYGVDVAANDLAYPTSIEFDAAGAMYVAEGGYIYGDEIASARVLRISPEGKKEVVADQLLGPVTDLLWHEERLFIAQRGKISVLEPGGVRDLVTDLPSFGDHHNNQMTIGPDGKLYFGQGTATNSGVVGLDNFKIGWLAKHPTVHDVPAKDIRLRSEERGEGHPQEFKTPNLLAMLADDVEEPMSGHEDEMKNMKGMEHGANGEKSKMQDKGMKGMEHGGKHSEPEQEMKGMQHTGMGGHLNMAKTGPFEPFGKSAPPDRTVDGETKANGTVLRMNTDGSNLEVFAWGLRNPFGLMWGPDGKLYASDNGYDERGSRPIAHAPDVVWMIEQDGWYGFPDYAAGIPVTEIRFKPERGPALEFLMRDHPPIDKPLASLASHAGIAKIDFSRSARFGFEGQMFLALAGNMNPITGQHGDRSGFEVIRLDPETGKTATFFRTRPESLGPKGMEYVQTAGPKRPVDVRFSREGGSLYVVDIGAVAIVPTAIGPMPRPIPGTGAVWRITRDADSRH